MRMYLLFFVVLFFSISTCTQRQSGKNSSSFSDELYNIDQTSNWSVDDHGAFVYFKTSLENESDKFQENVVVYTASLDPKNQTLVEFFEKSVETLVATTQNFTLIYYKQIELSSTPAEKIIYSEDSELGKIQYLQVFTVKDEKVYILTYTALAEDYQKNVADAESIIASFKIK